MSEAELKIIFVDDEVRVLDGLRRQLHAHRAQWDMRFALSGAEALAMLAERGADIVVADMRMPKMSGGELFQRMLGVCPETTRITLSGQTDQTDLLRNVGVIHHYLQKPCDPVQVCHAIERTFALYGRLRDPQLRKAASRVTALPPGSDTYRRLIDALSKADASVGTVSKIVGEDPALSAKVMQLVNSSFFGMPRKVASPQDAIMLLGLATLRAIVVSGRLFEFVGGVAGYEAEVGRLWKTSYEIGERAQGLAEADGASVEVQQRSRMAGLLCLIGRAILLTTGTADYAELGAMARESGRSLAACEVERLGASQDEITAYAMGLWAFPDEIVEAMAYQSAPSRVPNVRPKHLVGYLHLARCMRGGSEQDLDGPPALDEAYVAGRELAAKEELERRLAA